MLKKIVTSIIRLILATALIFSLSECHSAENPKQIRIGTISGPESELMQVAKQVALQHDGLSIKIIEFSDYSLPNTALNERSLDANLFQHQRFLAEEIQNRHYQLVAIAKQFVYPMGIYSLKIHDLNDLKPHAIVAIPNDVSNEARALLLLSKTGLITLNNSNSRLITPRNIVNNTKQLRIKELDAAQLSRALADVDLAIINTNYAVLANLYTQNALYAEDKDSGYANLLVVRKEDEHNPKFVALIKALHSTEVLAAAEKLFHGEAIPAWK